MKKYTINLSFWLSVIVLTISFAFYSCKKNDENENNATLAILTIKSFTFTYGDENYTAIVDNTNRTISPPEGFSWFSESNDVITPTIVLDDEDNSTISPESEEKINISSPVTYTVTDKNDSNLKATYTLDFSDSEEKNIIQTIKRFTFTYGDENYTAIVDNTNRTISPPNGFEFFRDSVEIEPSIVLNDEDNNTISSENGAKIDMKEENTYTVTSKHGASAKYKFDFRNAEALYGLANKDIVLYEDFSKMPTVGSLGNTRGKAGVVTTDDGSKVFVLHPTKQLYIPLTIGKKASGVRAYYTRGEDDRGGPSESNYHMLFWDNDWDKTADYKVTMEYKLEKLTNESSRDTYFQHSFSKHYLEKVRAGSEVIVPQNDGEGGKTTKATSLEWRYRGSHYSLRTDTQTTRSINVAAEHIDVASQEENRQNLLIYAICGYNDFGTRNRLIIYSIKIEKIQP